MDTSIHELAHRLETHLRNGALDAALLSVLGGSGAAAAASAAHPPALADVAALLTHLAALPRQHRQRFQDALTQLRAGQAWHRDLEHTLALLDRPNESCLWCRARLVELQTAEHLKEMLQAFGYPRATGRKDELANLLVLLLPFCVATRAASRPAATGSAAAAAAAAAPPAAAARVASVADAADVAGAPPGPQGAAAERPATQQHPSGPQERRRERATFRRTTALDGSTTEEAVFEREVMGAAAGAAAEAPATDTTALATFFAEHFYGQYNAAALRSADVELFVSDGSLLVDDTAPGDGDLLLLGDTVHPGAAKAVGCAAHRPDALALQLQSRQPANGHVHEHERAQRQLRLSGPSAAIEMLHSMRTQHGIKLEPDLANLRYPSTLTPSNTGQRMLQLRVHGWLHQTETADKPGTGGHSRSLTETSSNRHPERDPGRRFQQDFRIVVGQDSSVQVEESRLQLVCASSPRPEGSLLLPAAATTARSGADGEGEGEGKWREPVDISAKNTHTHTRSREEDPDGTGAKRRRAR